MAPGEQQMLDIRVQMMDGRSLGLSDLPRRQVRILSLTPRTATVSSSGRIYARAGGAAWLQVEVTLDGETHTARTPVGIAQRPLRESDFVLDGPYGSYGSRVEKVGENHFRYVRGGHPEIPSRLSLPQFTIPANFKGNHLVLDIESMGIPHPGHNYYLAYSFNGENWTPILQTLAEENVSRINIPATDSDSLYFGFQIPLASETAERLMQGWASDPKTARFVTIHEIGRSMQGRPLYRMEVTDPESPHRREDRWVHYVSQAHPHEGKARWRVKGMIDWLLSEEGRDARRRHIWHFVLTMNPDGVDNGFTRMNMEGIDMNRGYRLPESKWDEQAHEVFLYQRDIEGLMASETPLTTFWDMHVWPQRVEPLMHFGPEFGEGEGKLGDWTKLREMMEAADEQDLMKPLAERPFEGDPTMWDRGVHRQFGVTSAIVEGGGFLDTQEENMEAGRILIQCIDTFYGGTKPGHPPGAK